MQDAILIIGTSLEFLFGWILIKQLGCFLEENQKRIEEEANRKPKKCIYLDGNISPDELEKALSRFRSTHDRVKIMIYDPAQFSSLDDNYGPAM